MAYRAECVRSVSNWSKVTKEHKFDKKTFEPKVFKEQLPIASPKLHDLLSNIKELDNQDYKEYGKTFKHFIFSDLKIGGTGAKIIASALIAHGFRLAYDSDLKLLEDHDLMRTKKDNFIVLLSTSVYGNKIGVNLKKKLLNKFNQRPENVYGDLARIIIMDGGFKEGIDLFDIKYIHIFEPQVSKADQKQVIGRGTRTCGQKGLKFHPTQGWPLSVYIYDESIPKHVQDKLLTDEQKGNKIDTMFKLYMDAKGINLDMYTFQEELEKAAIVGSVDYELNKNIHMFEIEDETRYNVFEGGYNLVPSNKTINCQAKSCGKVRANKNVPIVTPLLTTAALAVGAEIPKMSNKGAYPREFFCNLMKTNLDFCEAVKKVNEDPVSFIKANSDKLLHAIRQKAYKGLPQSQRSSFIRLVFSVIPRPTIMRRLRKTQSVEKSIVSVEKLGNSVNESTQKTVGQAVTNTETVKTPEEIIREVEKDVVPIQPLSVSQNRSGNFIKMRNYVRENFMQYTWPKVKLENQCGYSGPTTSVKESPPRQFGGAEVMKLTPTQGFIANYFTPSNPLNGMLLHHSVGCGKTCTAIATASQSFEAEGYTILWVTRTTLKSDIWKNMFEQVCSSDIAKKVENGLEIPESFSGRMKLLSKAWSIRPMSYKQFSNLVEGKNSLYNDLVKLNGKDDPLRKTLLIIDEAHKLYGGADLSSIERPNMEKLHAALMTSYVKSGKDSVKLLLMTATPITNDPIELIKLLNLMRLPTEQIPTDYDTFQHLYLNPDGSFTKKGKFAFLNDIAGHISYLNRERDARQFSQPQVFYRITPMSETQHKEESQDDSRHLDETMEDIKEKQMNQKEKYQHQKNTLKNECVGLKGHEKGQCVLKVGEGLERIEKEYEGAVHKYQEELQDLKSQKANIRAQIKERKNSLANDISQEAVLLTKCKV